LDRHHVHIAANERGQQPFSKELTMTMLSNTSGHFARSDAIPSARPVTIRRKARFFLKSLARLIDGWIAALIAKRERQANLFILRNLGDRELSDMGLSRNQVGEGLCEAAKDRARQQASRRR
jgi:uncharacterized protein YjiS (DUF1127 family)